MSSSREPLRLVRGSIAATLATAVALIGHVAGGAVLPGWLGIVLPWWLSVTLCTVLAGRRFTLPRLSLAVLGSQALFHGLFMAGTPASAPVHLVAPPGTHLGHGTHGSDVTAHAADAHGADGVGVLAEHAIHGSHSDLQMLLGHLVAALVTTALLHRGETVLFRCFALAALVLDALRRPLRLAQVRVLAPPAPVRAIPAAEHLRHVQRAVISPQRRRGPPVVLAA